MRPQPNTRWTNKDDSYLLAHYRTKDSLSIAVLLGRTVRSVIGRASRIGASLERAWKPEEVATLRQAYEGVTYGEQIRLDELSQRLGRLKSNVCRKARSLGLTNNSRRQKKTRKDRRKYKTLAEARAAISVATKARLRERGHPRGALGMIHTPEALAKMSASSKARWASWSEEKRAEHRLKVETGRRLNGSMPPKSRRGKWYAGWREIGGRRVYMRSRWEANYCRYLEWLKCRGAIADWEYEARTFWFDGVRRGAVSYLPDFKVVNNDASHEWHEVKGWMDTRSATVLKRMAKYHPTEKVVVIREKQYREIRLKVSALIPGWEDERKRSDWKNWEPPEAA